MGFLDKLLGKKEKAVTSNADFWVWFQKNEKDFFKVIDERGDIVKDLFNKMSSKLQHTKVGSSYQAGMFDKTTAEIVFTAEGDIQHVAFIEDLVKQAPAINGWKFTALKPDLNIEDINIKMSGYLFSSEKMHFYVNELPGYPDEIDITVIHDDCTENNIKEISTGVYIFLDHLLGELNFVTTIDNMNVRPAGDISKDYIPISKLKDYLHWRQKEFIEKYEGVFLAAETANYVLMEAELTSGYPLIATVNTDLLDWDSKPSHPWRVDIGLKYDGHPNNMLPDPNTQQFLNKLEDDIMAGLSDKDGYLYIGRKTSGNVRTIYLACKDFRKPSKILYRIKNEYAPKTEIEYTMFKDKYWQSLDHFRPKF